MHELSVAESLVELVTDELGPDAPGRVMSVTVRIGPLSGVVPAALAFAYDAATAGTCLAGSALHIEEVPAAVYCPQCGRDSEITHVTSTHCPNCGSTAARIVRGRELEVASVTVCSAPPSEAPPGPGLNASEPGIREQI